MKKKKACRLIFWDILAFQTKLFINLRNKTEGWMLRR